MRKMLYDFDGYKEYLSEMLSTSGETRGKRGQLAEVLGCQSAFVSQVLNSHTHFSLEHAYEISSFLRHTESERNFFLLLVQRDRAGTKNLKSYYTAQIKDIREKRQLVHERLNVPNAISKFDEMTYYSSWIYAAIHVLLSVTKFQSAESLSKRLSLAVDKVSSCIEFLVQCGLAKIEKGIFKIGESRLHLKADSPLIAKHHMNWRMQSLRSLENSSKDDLHYSSVMAISHADYQKIKEHILKTLEETEKIIVHSPEEDGYVLGVDLFKL